MEHFSPVSIISTAQVFTLPSLRVTINVYPDSSAFEQALSGSSRGLSCLKEWSKDRKASHATLSDDGSEVHLGQQSLQTAEEDGELLEQPRESTFEFLHSFIYHSKDEFERTVENLALNEQDMIFIKRFLIKRIVSIKLKSEIHKKLNPGSYKQFIERAVSMRSRVFYQRNSNCLRAVFRKIIEFMKHNKHCPPIICMPNHDNFKSESYVQVVAELGILERFEEVIKSPDFRAFLLTNSENCFRANFFRWAKALSTDPKSDIRMSIYPADLDRALRDFESKLVAHKRK